MTLYSFYFSSDTWWIEYVDGFDIVRVYFNNPQEVQDFIDKNNLPLVLP
jgi:hypothetical protein